MQIECQKFSGTKMHIAQMFSQVLRSNFSSFRYIAAHFGLSKLAKYKTILIPGNNSKDIETSSIDRNRSAMQGRIYT